MPKYKVHVFGSGETHDFPNQPALLKFINKNRSKKRNGATRRNFGVKGLKKLLEGNGVFENTFRISKVTRGDKETTSVQKSAPVASATNSVSPNFEKPLPFKVRAKKKKAGNETSSEVMVAPKVVKDVQKGNAPPPAGLSHTSSIPDAGVQSAPEKKKRSISRKQVKLMAVGRAVGKLKTVYKARTGTKKLSTLDQGNMYDALRKSFKGLGPKELALALLKAALASGTTPNNIAENVLADNLPGPMDVDATGPSEPKPDPGMQTKNEEDDEEFYDAVGEEEVPMDIDAMGPDYERMMAEQARGFAQRTEEMTRQIKFLKEQLEAAKRELEAAGNAIGVQRANAQADVEKLRAVIKNLEAKLESVSGELKKEKAATVEAERKFAEQKMMTESVEGELRQEQLTSQQLRQRVQELTGELQTLNASGSDLRKKLNTMQRYAEIQEEQYRVEKDTYIRDLSDVYKKVKRQDLTIRKKEEAIRRLEDKHEDILKRYSDMHQETLDKKLDIQSELENRIRALEQANTTLQALQQESAQAAMGAAQARDVNQQEIEALRKQAQKATQTIGELRNALAKSEARANELQEEIVQSTIRFNETREMLEAMVRTAAGKITQQKDTVTDEELEKKGLIVGNPLRKSRTPREEQLGDLDLRTGKLTPPGLTKQSPPNLPVLKHLSPYKGSITQEELREHRQKGVEELRKGKRGDIMAKRRESTLAAAEDVKMQEPNLPYPKDVKPPAPPEPSVEPPVDLDVPESLGEASEDDKITRFIDRVYNEVVPASYKARVPMKKQQSDLAVMRQNLINKVKLNSGTGIKFYPNRQISVLTIAQEVFEAPDRVIIGSGADDDDEDEDDDSKDKEGDEEMEDPLLQYEAMYPLSMHNRANLGQNSLQNYYDLRIGIPTATDPPTFLGLVRSFAIKLFKKVHVAEAVQHFLMEVDQANKTEPQMYAKHVVHLLYYLLKHKVGLSSTELVKVESELSAKYQEFFGQVGQVEDHAITSHIRLVVNEALGKTLQDEPLIQEELIRGAGQLDSIEAGYQTLIRTTDNAQAEQEVVAKRRMHRVHRRGQVLYEPGKSNLAVQARLGQFKAELDPEMRRPIQEYKAPLQQVVSVPRVAIDASRIPRTDVPDRPLGPQIASRESQLKNLAEGRNPFDVREEDVDERLMINRMALEAQARARMQGRGMQGAGAAMPQAGLRRRRGITLFTDDTRERRAHKRLRASFTLNMFAET